MADSPEFGRARDALHVSADDQTRVDTLSAAASASLSSSSDQSFFERFVRWGVRVLHLHPGFIYCSYTVQQNFIACQQCEVRIYHYQQLSRPCSYPTTFTNQSAYLKNHFTPSTNHEEPSLKQRLTQIGSTAHLSSLYLAVRSYPASISVVISQQRWQTTEDIIDS